MSGNDEIKLGLPQGDADFDCPVRWEGQGVGSFPGRVEIFSNTLYSSNTKVELELIEVW
jgi:hypothetical protein